MQFRSDALKRDMNVNVYLPKGYTDGERYPTLYLIHGYSGSQDGWVSAGVTKIADELIAAGKIRPLIILFPQIDNSYGINSAPKYAVQTPSDPKNSPFYGLYEDYLYKDLIPYIDAHYSTIKSREGRSIGGNSMGGFAAIHLAFRHPELFSKVGGHSPAIWVNLDRFMEAWLFPNPELRNERDPLQLVQTQDLKGLQVYLDCGSEDALKLYEGSGLLHKALQQRGVESQYHLRPGPHGWVYWQLHFEEYLMFYAGK